MHSSDCLALCLAGSHVHVQVVNEVIILDTLRLGCKNTVDNSFQVNLLNVRAFAKSEHFVAHMVLVEHVVGECEAESIFVLSRHLRADVVRHRHNVLEFANFSCDSVSSGREGF